MKLINISVKSMLRVIKTTQVITTTGLSWVLGDRPPKPALLRRTFEKLGATYIKLGQFIASSPSIFPGEYVTEFQKCLDNTPVTPYESLLPLLQSELKAPIDQIFSNIDPNPLASASIAQVHRATLTNGIDVVIKIQKPGVRNVIETDLTFLVTLAKLFELIAPRLNMASISGILEEIQNGMMDECDFEKEARNIEDFHRFLEKHQIQDVIAPKVYHHASSEKVLTMEYLEGTPFTDLDAVKHVTSDPQISLIAAMNTWFSTLLEGRRFHADVHAGNLLVLKDGRVAFIDFGIVGQIEKNTWSSVAQFIQAVTDLNYREMATAMVGIGATKENVNITSFATDIENIYNQMGSSIENNTDLNQNLIEIMSVAKNYGIHFPRAFALLLKQILYFDRYVQLLAPDIGFYQDDRLSFLPELHKQV